MCQLFIQHCRACKKPKPTLIPAKSDANAGLRILEPLQFTPHFIASTSGQFHRSATSKKTRRVHIPRFPNRAILFLRIPN